MLDALENKVSELIAENDILKLSNIKLKKQHSEFETDISELKIKVQSLTEMLEESGRENHHL
jgi:regulator of replication initiation timing